jgi:glycosyltransferase involved in cell wall biosynthesis
VNWPAHLWRSIGSAGVNSTIEHLPRLALYAHTLDHGGIARVVYTIAQHLGRHGVLTAVVGATRKQTAPVLNTDVGLIGFDLAVRRGHAFAVPALARWLRWWQPDVLFAHGTAGSSTAILARLVSRVPTRLIAVEHTHYSSFIPTGGLGRRLRRMRDLETGLLYPLAEAVAGISTGVMEDLARRFPSVRPKLVVLPPPGRSSLDVQRLAGVLPNHPWFQEHPSPRIVTCVATIVPGKSQETLIEALPHIRARAGDVRLVLVGRMDDARYKEQLEREAERLGVKDRVSLVGYASNPLSFMAHSDLVALSSRSEGYPLVLIEAMACRVPVVATDCPTGPAEALEGGAGLLVPVGDHLAMAESIVRVLSDARLRGRLVERGEERARAHEPELVAGAYLQLARRVTGRLSVAGPRGPRRGTPSP